MNERDLYRLLIMITFIGEGMMMKEYTLWAVLLGIVGCVFGGLYDTASREHFEREKEKEKEKNGT